MSKLNNNGQIIVCSEKHGTTYWDASSELSWAKSALAILTERWEQSRNQEWCWYPEPEEPSTKGYTYVNKNGQMLSEVEISALPNEHLRVAAMAESRRFERKIKEAEEYRLWYERVKWVVQSQDHGITTRGKGANARRIPVAWDLLNERCDYEYEAVRLETLNVI